MGVTRCVALALICAGCALADLREQGPKDSAPSGLLAGVARADITPPVGIPQLNWGSQTHVEAVGLDPNGMLATALVLSDGKQKFALVDIDAISADRLEGAIARAAERTGIPASHIHILEKPIPTQARRSIAPKGVPAGVKHGAGTPSNRTRVWATDVSTTPADAGATTSSAGPRLEPTDVTTAPTASSEPL